MPIKESVMPPYQASNLGAVPTCHNRAASEDGEWTKKQRTIRGT
jgi:hypothetical protein